MPIGCRRRSATGWRHWPGPNSIFRNRSDQEPCNDRQRAKLSIVHAKDAEFVVNGLRSQFVYRDLAIKDATAGRFHAHVIKPQNKNEASQVGLHRHNEIDFQLVYILEGWIRFWYEGHGETAAKAGTCNLQPPGISHDVIEWSDDLELLEITSPDKFETESLDERAAE